MWAMLAVGILFLGGAAYNVFGSEPNFTEAIGGSLIAAILIGLFFATRFHKRKADEFETWLLRNAKAIERGGALYQEALVTPASVLTRYQIAVSFLIVTFKFQTRIYIVGHDRTTAIAGVCTFISLGLGWWGIPWGPIYTVQVVARNLRGGITQAVSERLSPVPVFARSTN